MVTEEMVKEHYRELYTEMPEYILEYLLERLDMSLWLLDTPYIYEYMKVHDPENDVIKYYEEGDDWEEDAHWNGCFDDSDFDDSYFQLEYICRPAAREVANPKFWDRVFYNDYGDDSDAWMEVLDLMNVFELTPELFSTNKQYDIWFK